MEPGFWPTSNSVWPRSSSARISNKLFQKLQLFPNQLTADECNPGYVCPWPIETRNQPSRDRINRGCEYDGYGLRGGHDIPDAGGGASSNNDGDLAAHEIRREFAHSFDPAVGPPVVDSNVSSVNETYFGDTAAKCVHVVRPGRSRDAVNRPYDRDCLLRARCKRPRSRPAAEQRDELAPLHSITSSERASSVGATSRPSALAVLRLITSSYLVGACTGISAGFSPLRMRST